MTSRKLGNGTGPASRTLEQAGQLRERWAPAVGRAGQAAREQTVQAAGQARDWAAPRVEAAVEWAAPRWERGVEWAAPRLERGVERGIRAAAPRIEAAAERAVPAVDAVRDRIVEEVLPRLVEAVNTAAVAGAAAGRAATEDGARRAKVGLITAADRAGEVTGTKRRRRTARRVRLVVVAAAGAAAVAGVSAWRRSHEDDGWDVPLGGTPPTGTPPTPTSAPEPGTLANPLPEGTGDVADRTSTEGPRDDPA